MTDISTSVMGLKLKNPIIVGSCSLTNETESIEKLEKAGAGAVVLKSLFEEQITNQVYANTAHYSHPETMDYVQYFEEKHIVENYLKLIKETKSSVDIPVIASINCKSHGKWIEFAREIEKAGADAIELNLYSFPSDPKVNEHNYMSTASKIINEITSTVNIPVTMKLSNYSDNLAYDLLRLSRSNVSGLILFNRPFTPDIDINSQNLVAGDPYSSPEDISNTLRWVAISSDFIETDVIAATGIHDGEGIIKQLLAGANAVQMVSSIYINSPDVINVSISKLKEWMQEHNYSSIDQFRGKLKRSNIEQKNMYDRVQFIKNIHNK